ncbi:MAG: hypothetical protein JXA69_06690, partial [Phycisphaerae bacterium]|nr:hypothetical protein [Phycisphaerae bacterium]
GGRYEQAARFDLTADRAYQTLSQFGRPSLIESAREPYLRGYSTDGQGLSRQSQLLDKLEHASVHETVELDDDDLARLSLWMDTYAQKAGSFSLEQERQLTELRRQYQDLLIERQDSSEADLQ